jgi:[ribosomal protein S5]-alanine N-acetyltransferase
VSAVAAPLTLKGDRVVLRDFTVADVDDAASIVGDERVTRWLSFERRDLDSARRMVEAAIESAGQDPRSEYYLAVVEPANGQVVGFARLALSGVRAAKLGYAVHADHWGKGYAPDAVRAVVGHGFDALGLHRITAAVGPDNERSVAVLRRLGFTLEGRLRDHVHTNGAWRDSLLLSLLEHDRRSPQPVAPRSSNRSVRA